MYYVGLKCHDDPYDLDYLDFKFENIEELFNFVKLILNTSEHEMRIFKYEK
jgi:hypothetical protein